MTLAYCVHAPTPYSHRSAGYRALYKLAHDLNELGEETAIYGFEHPYLANLSSQCPFELADAADYTHGEVVGAVHLYPEIIAGNPGGSERVVRWLLNRPIYEPARGDLVVAWDQNLVTVKFPRLVVDVIEPELFWPNTEPRSGYLYYGGKGAHVAAVPLPHKVISPIWPETRAELADELRSAELLVSFDECTMLNVEALICGCPVFLAKGSVSPSIFPTMGLATKEDEIDAARSVVGEAAWAYQAMRDEIADDVANLVRLCKEWWR